MRFKSQNGVTLVELLAALLVSGLVLVIASRIFLSGKHQFLSRTADSKKIETLFHLKKVLQSALNGEIEECLGGKLTLRQASTHSDLQMILKKKFPEILTANLHCLEVSSDQTSLVDWKLGFQPRLVEYTIILKNKGNLDTLLGSWIK